MSADTSHLQCLCGAFREPASLIDAEHYPVEQNMCHCNTCRQTSGALFNTFVKLNGRPSQAALDACTVHALPNGRGQRYFCSICGTRTFDCVPELEKWLACSGTVERKSLEGGMDVTRIASHIFVGDTKDGGLAARLQKVGSQTVTLHDQWPAPSGGGMSSHDVAQLAEHKPSTRTGSDSDRLIAACCCDSIKFNISPPTATQAQHTNVARWLRAGGTKYLALNCVCRYCRLALGFPISSNTYVMPENIHVIEPDGSETNLFAYNSLSQDPIDFDVDTHTIQARSPSLKFDFTSPGIRRSFCGKCGASVFFERATRPQCVNIAVGILRAESGSLAQDWIEFDWKGTCWKEEAVDPSMVEALERSAT